ncbi:unnamed protein product [Cochlearia groenlandica]
MDCNKEEAVKAKKLAEEKIQAGDYVGAHRFVTKAQRLFPNLENIPQMIAICDVHSTANKKINGLDNWYGILQVQPFSDAETIRKQYRKLALLLHPDKNKFVGAEAAFKLVGEANRRLSNPITRSQYDVRYRSQSVLAAKHSIANSVRRSAAAKNPLGKISSDYTFWTCCKNCGNHYKYLKEYINRVMHCSACKKSYTACNMGDERVPLNSSTAGKKGIQNQEKYNLSRQNASRGAESGSSTAELNKNRTVRGEPNQKNQDNKKKVAGKRKPMKDEGCIEKEAEGGNPQKGMNISAEIPEADVLKPQPEVKETSTKPEKLRHGLTALKKNQASKKRTKAVEESSKSVEVDGSDAAGAKTCTNEFNMRRSPRKNPQVYYTERGRDGDFLSPPTKKTKSGCEFESDSNTKQMTEDNKSREFADAGVSSVYVGNSKKSVDSGNEDTLSAKNKESEGCHSNGQDAECSSKIDKVEDGYKANISSNTLHKADPEFNVFEVRPKPENFAVNQVWSVSDSRDGMPRKYVQVKEVLNTVFELLITHLEPVQDMNDENIPFACGKFESGKIEEVEDRSIFSGQMHHLFCEKHIFIYPRKGEIWAIFRDWNEEWSTGLEKHKLPYKYDFVEVLSDFSYEVGLGVAYLGKVKGFASRFHWEAQRRVCQIQFTPQEILRFSHKVPAVKVTEKEKECSVPGDSYELDRAALPKDILQVDAVDMEMDKVILKGEADGPCPEAPKVEVKSTPVPKTALSPRKHQKPDIANGIGSNLGEAESRTSISHNFSSCQVDEMNTLNKSRKRCEASDFIKLRKSPRLNTISSQHKVEKKSSNQGSKMNTTKSFATDSLGVRKSPSETREGESLKKQRRNGELHSLSQQTDLATQLNGFTTESPETTLASQSSKTLQRNAFDFKNRRSEDKFRVNQLWAIYSKVTGMPSEYVKIRKIESKPKLMLHVTHMAPHPPSTDPLACPVSCGDFKLKMGRPKILPQARFSHQVEPVHNKNTIVKVHPRKGEIWALYKNRDSTKEEHEIVEVVEDYSDGEIAKTVALTAKGSASLYIMQRKLGDPGFIDIPKAEVSRFSHQIPAMRHEKKKTTRLVAEGYWELDQTAIPSSIVVLD